MIDFLSESRQAMIENLQISLRAIRNLMGYSAAELADYMGVTRQTINNLEIGKARMSSTQYISIAAVVDNYIISNGEMFNAIEAIIDGNGRKISEDLDTSFSNHSLLKRWFACFNDSVDIGFVVSPYDSMEAYDASIQELIIKYKIFVDSDVLLAPKVDEFMLMLADYLSDENAKVIIPVRAIEQIQEMIQDISVSEKAVKALKLINSLQRTGVVQLRGEGSDSNLHDTILSVFAKFRSLHRLCLITQSESFANEINFLNENSEKRGFDIVVGHIDGNGKFVLYSKPKEPLSEICAVSDDGNNSEFTVIPDSLPVGNESADVDLDVSLNLTDWSQL